MRDASTFSPLINFLTGDQQFLILKDLSAKERGQGDVVEHPCKANSDYEYVNSSPYGLVLGRVNLRNVIERGLYDSNLKVSEL